MRKKGFTLIELLVVISIIAMLLAILMPALNKVKKIAQRVVCGTNLKGLGTAQTVYANDYDDEYAVQGGGGLHTWADNTLMWQNNAKQWKTDLGGITVGASLYLLVREADVSPKSFVCPSSGQQEFEGKNALQADIVELWDFGSNQWNAAPDQNPMNCSSYSYHNPYNGTTTGSKGTRAPDGGQSAAFAVMADRNPYIDDELTNGGLAADGSNFMEVVSLIGGSTAPAEGDYEDVENNFVECQNSQPHSREGQNVLFGDGHSANEKRADVGVKNDNIYTAWTAGSTGATEEQRRRGEWPGKSNVDTVFIPRGTNDSALVNDAAGLELD